MTMRDDDDRRKPYGRTYRGGSGRRRSSDDELAGRRPARGETAGRRATQGTGQAAAEVRPAQGEGFAWDDAAPGNGGRKTQGTGAYHRYEAGGAAAGTAARSVAQPARRRRLRWWHIPLALLTALVIVGVVLTVLAYPGYKTFDQAVAKSNDRLDAKTRAALTPNDGLIIRNPTTVLVLGTDSRTSGEPARSDTIMLMRFDPRAHTGNQLSIPRDTKVEVPGRGTMKINEAMFWGGPSLAVKTVADYVGIPVNHVMVLNFQGFWRVVRAVGGVDFYVPETISTTAGGRGRVVTFKKGWHHFDSKNALLYVRIRKTDNDFKRAGRQQLLLRALQKELIQPSNLTKLPDVGSEFMSGVDTDLTTTQLLQLAWVKWRADDQKSRHWVLAGEPAYIGGVAFVLPPSDAKKQKIIDRFLGR